MSEKYYAVGFCGEICEGTIWKQGTSIRCEKGEMSVVTHPRVEPPKKMVQKICPNCEHKSINNGGDRTEETP